MLLCCIWGIFGHFLVILWSFFGQFWSIFLQILVCHFILGHLYPILVPIMGIIIGWSPLDVLWRSWTWSCCTLGHAHWSLLNLNHFLKFKFSLWILFSHDFSFFINGSLSLNHPFIHSLNSFLKFLNFTGFFQWLFLRFFRDWVFQWWKIQSFLEMNFFTWFFF